MVVFANSLQKTQYENFFDIINKAIRKELEKTNFGVFNFDESNKENFPITKDKEEWTQNDIDKGELAFDDAAGGFYEEVTEPTLGNSYYKPITIITVSDYYENIESIAYLDNGKFLMIPDKDYTFDIDLNNREIKIPTGYQNNGVAVYGDHKAEVLYFTVGRYFDYMDLNNTKIFINWEYEYIDNNKNKQIVNGISKAFAPYITTNTDDNDISNGEGKICFGWILTDNVTRASSLKFSVSFQKIDESDSNNILYVLNTKDVNVRINSTLILDQPSIDQESNEDFTNISIKNSEIYATSFSGLYWKQEPTTIFNFDITSGDNPSKYIQAETYCATPGTGLKYIIEKEVSSKNFESINDTLGQITYEDVINSNIDENFYTNKDVTPKDNKRSFYKKNGETYKETYIGDFENNDKVYTLHYNINPLLYNDLTPNDDLRYRIKAYAYDRRNNNSDPKFSYFKILKPYKIKEFHVHEDSVGDKNKPDDKFLYFKINPDNNENLPITLQVLINKLQTQNNENEYSTFSDFNISPSTKINSNNLSNLCQTFKNILTNNNNNSYTGKFELSYKINNDIYREYSKNGVPYVSTVINPVDIENNTKITFNLRHFKNNDVYPNLYSLIEDKDNYELKKYYNRTEEYTEPEGSYNPNQPYYTENANEEYVPVSNPTEANFQSYFIKKITHDLVLNKDLDASQKYYLEDIDDVSGEIVYTLVWPEIVYEMDANGRYVKADISDTLGGNDYYLQADNFDDNEKFDYTFFHQPTDINDKTIPYANIIGGRIVSDTIPDALTANDVEEFENTVPTFTLTKNEPLEAFWVREIVDENYTGQNSYVVKFVNPTKTQTVYYKTNIGLKPQRLFMTPIDSVSNLSSAEINNFYFKNNDNKYQRVSEVDGLATSSILYQPVPKLTLINDINTITIEENGERVISSDKIWKKNSTDKYYTQVVKKTPYNHEDTYYIDNQTYDIVKMLYNTSSTTNSNVSSTIPKLVYDTTLNNEDAILVTALAKIINTNGSNYIDEGTVIPSNRIDIKFYDNRTLTLPTKLNDNKMYFMKVNQ